MPAVCALELSVGGLLYTGIPFNGWYADVEVVRDLCDEARYNMLKPVCIAHRSPVDLPSISPRS